MTPFISIAGRKIGADFPPYIVAELSANHNGKLDTALKVVDAAKAAGAHAIKLQTYTPDTITLDARSEEFTIRGGLWNGRTLYELYQEAHMPWEWHKPLFEYAREVGIVIFSSPFDTTAVDLLEDLNAPAYKIASFEAIDIPLIRYVAGTRKPMIISTGMADAEEIGEAVTAARDGGCREIALLRCVSAYPAPAREYNLRTIPDMAKRFDCVVGLSDHTLGNATAIASIALGGALVEKHFTLDRRAGGPDSSFSLEPGELAALCENCLSAWESLGAVQYRLRPSEQDNIKFRRSLYFTRALKAGDTITHDAIRSVRPGYGLPPKALEQVVGRRVKVDVEPATPVSWNIVDLD